MNGGIMEGLRKKVKTALADYLAKLDEKGQTETGAEIVSDVPMAPPIGYKRQPSMVEHIRSMVRSEQLRMAAEEAGQESFEEADDFDIPDELEPVGSSEMFEHEFEPLVRPAEPGEAEKGSEADPAAAAPGSASGAPVEPPSPKKKAKPKAEPEE